MDDNAWTNTPAAPGWVRGADVLTVLLGGMALYVAIAGRPFLTRYGMLVLPSTPVLLFASAGALVIRHVAWPRPTILDTLARWKAALDRRPFAASAFRAFVFTRPMVFFVAYFAVVTIGFPDRPVGFTLSTDPLDNLPARYDAGWYGDIARRGYQWDRQFQRQRNIAFFPAMPMLMRPVGSFLGANTPTMPANRRLLRMLWAGVIVSLAAFAWALYYFARLSDALAGPHAAATAPLLLAAYPFAVFFNAPYTESIFLLSVVGCFYHFHRGEWLRAAIWGLIVGLSRPNGALVSVPLAALSLQQLLAAREGHAWSIRDWVRPLSIRLGVAAMPGIGMLGFTAYLYWLTGVWFAWARIQEAWGRDWGTEPLERGWTVLTTEGVVKVTQGLPYDSLNTLAIVFALALTWAVFRRVGLAYGLFVLVNLLPPVFAGGALSMGRITSTLFPLFIALAAMLRPGAVTGWVASFAIMQGFVAALFFTWRELF